MIKKRIRYKLYCEDCGLKAVTKTGNSGGRLPAGKMVYSDREAIAAVNYHAAGGRLLCDSCFKKHQKKLAKRAKISKKMKKRKDTKYCHLLIGDRWIIKDGLDHGRSLTAIARELNVSTSTVTREVKKHAEAVYNESGKGCYVDCAVRNECPRHVCLMATSGKCGSYKKEICERHQKAPYVCNGCAKYNSCVLDKMVYNPGTAEKESRRLKSECRSKKKLSDSEIKALKEKIEPRLKGGESLYNISRDKALKVSLSTLYRYKKEGIL